MGLESAISLSPTTLVLKCFSGHDIASNRIIELVCKLHPDEARTCKETFYVYPTPIVDMVLGIELIKSERLLEPVTPLMLIGVALHHTKKSKGK